MPLHHGDCGTLPRRGIPPRPIRPAEMLSGNQHSYRAVGSVLSAGRETFISAGTASNWPFGTLSATPSVKHHRILVRQTFRPAFMQSGLIDQVHRQQTTESLNRMKRNQP